MQVLPSATTVEGAIELGCHLSMPLRALPCPRPEQPVTVPCVVKVRLPALTWATLELFVVQALAWSEMALVSLWLRRTCTGGVKVTTPVNFRQVMLPVATVSLVGAAAAGGALRTNGAQNNAKIAADGTTGHLGRRGERSRTAVTIEGMATSPCLFLTRVVGPGTTRPLVPAQQPALPTWCLGPGGDPTLLVGQVLIPGSQSEIASAAPPTRTPTRSPLATNP